MAFERLDIEQPRPFGYQIGDKFERRIHAELRQPYRLELDALPVAGRLGEWLALEAPVVSERSVGQSTHYDIRLTYQIINLHQDLKDIAVPQHELLYSDGGEPLKVLVPAKRVGVSMLRTRGETDLRDDIAPPVMAASRWPALAAAAVLLFSLLGLVHLYRGLPSPIAARPFTRTLARVRGLRGDDWDDARYREVLRDIHHAFNATAGHTVFAETLDAFFDEHAPYRTLREPITAWFGHSRACFFEAHAGDADTRYTPQALRQLLEQCSDIERGLA